MKVPLSWMKEFLDVTLSPSEIAQALTMVGLEVDGCVLVGNDFSKVVTAEILTTEKHPNADKLAVAQVYDGQDTYQIVCGASNCRPGIKVALAKIGAVLKDEAGGAYEIKKGKLRGVESFGMLCGADELGLGESEGIIELPDDSPLGVDFSSLVGDTIFEISLTPNLSHCTSVIGVVRELAAKIGGRVRLPEIQIKEGNEALDSFLKVNVKDCMDCPRYTCRMIKNIRVGPSPEWLKKRLEMSGVRSVNNVVDATNYVLLERGHPLHAFDYDRLAEHRLVIRMAAEGESITTLDGKERVLRETQLVIADGESPVAIAGVMGGQATEVTESTTTVVIESAYFNAGIIRRTSKQLGLQTDASKRFERGTDPNQLLISLDRAVSLIQEIAGGEILKGFIDLKYQEFPKLEIDCRFDKINQILGIQMSRSEVENIFERLDFDYKWNGSDAFRVKVPTYRVDLKEEIDLIEEVAKLYGYENIGKETASYRSSQIPSDPHYLFELKVKNRLIAEGLQEFLTCDLIGPSILEVVQEEMTHHMHCVKVLNPTSIEQSILRTSLLPGLLSVVKHNGDHHNANLAGFEVGKIHFKDENGFQEPSVVGLVLTGAAAPHFWGEKGRDYDFYDLKGIVENMLKEFGIKKAVYRNLNLKTFHSGRQASLFVGELEIGSIGEVHPAILRRLGVNQRILFGEFNIPDLIAVAQPVNHIKDLPVYPGSDRDWTVTIKKEVPSALLIDSIYSQASPILEKVYIADIFSHEKLGQGYHNVTLRFQYRDPLKTIEQTTVDAVHHRLLAEVIHRLGESIKI